MCACCQLKTADLQEVLELVASSVRHFSDVNLSTAVSRMGKLQPAPGKAAHAMQHPAIAQLKAAISAPLAAGSASAPCHNACLCSLLLTPCKHGMASGACADAVRRASELTPRAVANILHGFAAMGHHPGKALLGACAAQAVKRTWEATPQNVANILGSYAKLQHNPGDALLAACAAQALERIREATPQNLANTVRSFATLQHHPGSALLRSCEAAAVRSAAAFSPQSVVCDMLLVYCA